MLPQPVEIEQVGSNFIAELAGPALIAVAAVVAAIVAARTANARQREQLDHDLVVRSIEHTGDAIDQAVEMVHDTLLAVLELEEAIPVREQVSWSRLEAKLNDPHISAREKAEIRQTISSQRAAVKQAHDRAMDQIAELRRPIMRLKLRLGRDNEIPAHLKSLQSHWVSMAAGLFLEAGRYPDLSTEEIIMGSKKTEVEASDVYDAFLSSCERWLTKPHEAILHSAGRGQSSRTASNDIQ